MENLCMDRLIKRREYYKKNRDRIRAKDDAARHKRNGTIPRIILTKNENYFSNLSLQSSYWAGFIAADGSINERVLEIGLKDSEINHLVKFAADCGWNGTIGIYRKSCGFALNNKKCKMSISSIKKWKNDLENIYNITPNKTYVLKPPLNLSEENVLAFIVGFLDGDGYLGIEKNRYVIEVNCASIEFIEWLFKRLKDLTELKIKSKIRFKSKEKMHIKRFSISGLAAKDIIIKLNNLNIYKLERKWGKFNEDANV